MNSTAFFTASGQPIQLGKRIGKGGEGEVYVLAARQDVAAKIYTISDPTSRQAKIEAMIASSLATTSPLIAFPIEVLRDSRGAFAGFTMRLVQRHQPLHELYSPGARKVAFPRADYRFLVRAAANIARAVAAANRSGCVIGDINHSGILVSDQATVALIDADSFQVTAGGARYLCRVGVPEYTPPELQGQTLNVLRSPNHDAFGLAVVCFQLLFMGRHPFAGRFAKGDMPFERAITEFRFAYTRTRSVEMQPPPGVPILTDFPTPISQAFEQAFGPSGPQKRPDAAQWVALLEELEQNLRTCSANSLHRYPQAAPSCPWCRMESTLGAQLFIPPHVGASAQTANPGGSIDDWREVWRKIESFSLGGAAPSAPSLPSLNLSPSADARAAIRTNWRQAWFGLVLVGGSIAMFAIEPQGFWLWLGLIAFGIYKLRQARSANTEPVRRRAEAIEQRWADALARWQAQIDERALREVRAELDRTKREIEGLASDERRRLSEHEGRQRHDQLHRYLDQYQIRHAAVQFIGSSRRALLASYGIETAADVSTKALYAVPGFGPANSRPLLEWRQRLEAGFRFNSAQTSDVSAAIKAIRSETANKHRLLINKLGVGAGELARTAQQIETLRRTGSSELQQLHREREQVRADLDFLGLPYPPPAIPRFTSSANSGWPSGATPQHQPRPNTYPFVNQRMRSNTVSAACPRCGSSMLVKTARRGRGAGRNFFGCSRYPLCKGTRPYP